MLSSPFQLFSEYKPAGDQSQAIKKLVSGLESGMNKQTLLGATGTGKTFTMANVIQEIGKPTLVIAHNKTLAAQLTQEFKGFFPKNAVHYFVSYYDYYQPEAYVPTTDTFIEKEAMINQEIERLRHATTQALLTRRDVIIVASVSCIYGLGSPEQYLEQHFKIQNGLKISRSDFIHRLIHIFYERTNTDLKAGLFRSLGNTIEIMPVNEQTIYRIILNSQGIEYIEELDHITREIKQVVEMIFLFPAKHFVTHDDDRRRAVQTIEEELASRLEELDSQGKILEYQRLKRRTNYDLALIKELGYCNGIENYSRHFSGKNKGEAPDTLLSYFPKTEGKPDFLTIIDESHVTVSQIGAMYSGDRSRKETLIEHGFRLPSALDNRPLMFNEFLEKVGPMIYVSATPGNREIEESNQVVEQIIRPTGLVDPIVNVRPATGSEQYPGQVKDFISEAEIEINKGNRVIATTLTKKMAEDLSHFLEERGLRSKYLHSEIKTIERIETITSFRRGEFDILVGVNLLREGLDIPELTLIGILDADKEGFLRSDTSLIQIIGRAARNVDGRVILYADEITGSMKRAMEETDRRRSLQIAYNTKYGITPVTIQKNIHDITEGLQKRHEQTVRNLISVDGISFEKNPEKFIKQKEKQMTAAAKEMDFETAALIRDEIKELTKILEKSKKKIKNDIRKKKREAEEYTENIT
jgi:excinuclease ABC subunit B